MTRGQLVARAGRVMAMARSATDNVPEVALLQELAQEAVDDLLARTKIHVRRTSLALDAGVADYDLSQSVIRIWNLSFEDAPLTEVQEADFALYEGQHAFQFVGLNMFTIAWSPASGESLEALYTPLPTRMTDDNHDPALQAFGLIPVVYHGALINYMCWKAGEASRDQMSGMGEKFRRLYEGEDGLGGMGSNLGRIKIEVNRRGDSGSEAGRLRTMGERSAADAGASTWR